MLLIIHPIIKTREKALKTANPTSSDVTVAFERSKTPFADSLIPLKSNEKNSSFLAANFSSVSADAFNLMMKNIDTTNENQAYLAQQLLQAMVLGPPTTAPPIPTRTAGIKISLMKRNNFCVYLNFEHSLNRSKCSSE